MLNAEAAAQKTTRRGGGGGGGLQLLPAALHAGMSAANQAAALHPTPRGRRKVIQITTLWHAQVTLLPVPNLS